MDDLDRDILRLLAGDARMSVAVIARKLKVARSTAQARLERLESSGVIAGYTLRLGEALRAGRIRASVLVSIEPRSQPAILARRGRGRAHPHDFRPCRSLARGRRTHHRGA